MSWKFKNFEDEFALFDRKNIWQSIYTEVRGRSVSLGGTTVSIKEARKRENHYLNRYRDVSPYDHSRVRLQRGEFDYINASLVEVPSANRSYILTQGPLKITTGHFWLMVWEQKCSAIIMLNRLVEKNTVKCHQYWPAGEANGGEDQYALRDVGLLVSYEKEERVPNYTVRTFTLLDFQTGKSRTILQFHYTTWPDFGVPDSPRTFLSFLFAVRDAGVLDGKVGPPVVHCSAGIGRSGTFCLVDSCLVLVEKSGDRDCVNIRDMLVDMRNYRMGLIQTPDQLRFSYQSIIDGSTMLLNKEELFLSKMKEIDPISQTLDEKDEMSEENLSQSESSDEGIANSNTCTSASTSPPPVPPRPIRNHDASISNSISDLSLLPESSPKISPEISISPLLLEVDRNSELALETTTKISVENSIAGTEEHRLDTLASETTQEQLAEEVGADTEKFSSHALLDARNTKENMQEKNETVNKVDMFIMREEKEEISLKSPLPEVNVSVALAKGKTHEQQLDEEIESVENFPSCTLSGSNMTKENVRKKAFYEEPEAKGECESQLLESPSELRKRQRMERAEKTAAKVQQIKKKQKEVEIWQKRRLQKGRRSSCSKRMK